MSTETVETENVVIIADPSAVNPSAPYGTFSNGKPRKTAPKTASRSAGPKPPSPRPPRKASAARATIPNFTPLLTKAFRSIGTAVLSLGVRQRSAPLVADGMAVREAAPVLGAGFSEIVKASPRLQQMLTKAGPSVAYMDFGMAIVGLIAQIAANHGRTVPGMDVTDPQTLVDAAEKEINLAAAEEHSYVSDRTAA